MNSSLDTRRVLTDADIIATLEVTCVELRSRLKTVRAAIADGEAAVIAAPFGAFDARGQSDGRYLPAQHPLMPQLLALAFSSCALSSSSSSAPSSDTRDRAEQAVALVDAAAHTAAQEREKRYAHRATIEASLLLGTARVRFLRHGGGWSSVRLNHGHQK